MLFTNKTLLSLSHQSPIRLPSPCSLPSFPPKRLHTSSYSFYNSQLALILSTYITPLSLSSFLQIWLLSQPSYLRIPSPCFLPSFPPKRLYTSSYPSYNSQLALILPTYTTPLSPFSLSAFLLKRLLFPYSHPFFLPIRLPSPSHLFTDKTPLFHPSCQYDSPLALTLPTDKTPLPLFLNSPFFPKRLLFLYSHPSVLPIHSPIYKS